MVIKMRSLRQHLMQKFYSCCLIRDFLSTHATVEKRYTFHSEPWRSWRSSGVINKIWDLPSLYFHPSLLSYFLKFLLYTHLLPSFFWGGAFAKLRKATISFVVSVRLSVRPHGTTRLSMDVLSWNVIFDCFSKIFPENWSFIFWQELLYMKTDKHSWFLFSVALRPNAGHGPLIHEVS
jgi:hypothetical protein